MSYFKVCPHCGAALDPGEVCDCTLTQVCAEARTVFPERFTGRTDRQIVDEIAGVVRQYERLTPENQDRFDLMVDKLLEEQEAPPVLRTLARAGRNRLQRLFPPPMIPEIEEDCKPCPLICVQKKKTIFGNARL